MNVNPRDCLAIDFETASTVDLKKAGAYRYAEDASTHILCMAYRLPGDGVVRIWHEEELFSPIPRALSDALRDPSVAIRGWNVAFERLIYRHVLEKRLGAIADERWVDTQAEAQAMGLFADLDRAARVLGVDQQKDPRGRALIMKYCKPDRHGKFRVLAGEDRAAMGEYCMQDVRAEGAIAERVNRLLPKEREHWLAVLHQNDRGIGLDLPFIESCKTIVAEAERRANAELADVTDGVVLGVTKRAAMLAWLNARGLAMDALDKTTVKQALETDGLEPDVRRVLSLRADVARSSVAKLTAMQMCACKDGRARGLIRFHAASTGREGGALIQPQNFARGDDVPDAMRFHARVAAGEYDLIDLEAPPVAVVSALLRPCLIAGPGKELIAGDYSAIEARVLNWMAGEERMLDLFRQYDATGSKEFDPYVVNAALFVGIPWQDVQKFPHRQFGKVIELGGGYGAGGPKMAMVGNEQYGLTLSDDDGIRMRDFYREQHPRVVQWWSTLERGAMQAVKYPNTLVPVTGGVTFVMRGPWLLVKLPTGRVLYYARPALRDREMPWSTKEKPVFRECLSAWGIDSLTKQWGSFDLYGGLWAENIVQAVSRDILYDGRDQLIAAGYPSILTVHDEVVCEVPEGFGSNEDFGRLMIPSWAEAEGLPLNTEVWRGHHYRK